MTKNAVEIYFSKRYGIKSEQLEQLAQLAANFGAMYVIDTLIAEEKNTDDDCFSFSAFEKAKIKLFENELIRVSENLVGAKINTFMPHLKSGTYHKFGRILDDSFILFIHEGLADYLIDAMKEIAEKIDVEVYLEYFELDTYRIIK